VDRDYTSRHKKGMRITNISLDGSVCRNDFHIELM